MKNKYIKLISVFLAVVLMFSLNVYAQETSTGSKEYEVWTQSPYITCGITEDQMKLYKALEQDLLKVYHLPSIGENYYFAVCSHNRTNGGYKGNSYTSEHYAYTIYTTEDDFVVLSKGNHTAEYYWDSGFNIVDISGYIDKSYYEESDSEVPMYIINPKGKYTNLNVPEYTDYWIITDRGNIYSMIEFSKYDTDGFPYVNKGKLYRGQEKYMSGSSINSYTIGNKSASYGTPIIFKDGIMTYDSTLSQTVALEDMTGQNGYRIYKEGFESDIYEANFMKINGSDNLYFKTYFRKKFNGDSKYYYDLYVDVYKDAYNRKNLIKSYIIPTNKEKSEKLKYTELVGLDEAYYEKNGLPVPKVAIGAYAIVMRDGTVSPLNLDSSIYTESYYNISGYNGRLAITRNKTGSSFIFEIDPNNGAYCYWQAINELIISPNGSISLSPDIKLKTQSTPHEGQNGYYYNYNAWQTATFVPLSELPLKDWWKYRLKTEFSDGRYVRANWNGMGNDLYEMWYSVYNADGSCRSTGPTGHSTSYSTTFDTDEFFAFAINDSKFVVCLKAINSNFFQEYYRVTTVSEDENGEVITGGSIGEKIITPPTDSDTQIIQPNINFGKNELPIGYNIKDNVIDSDKLDVEVREQINTIKLNDIVILKNDDYQGGTQNTGATLSKYDNYDYSLGSIPIRFYTSGQNISWYCTDPTSLNAGVYNKMYEVGNKKIYVTIKIVEVPTNEGSTTVVF